jgi:hypothetical protein
MPACKVARSEVDALFDTTQSPAEPDAPVTPGDPRLETTTDPDGFYETVQPSTSLPAPEEKQDEPTLQSAAERDSALEAGAEAVEWLEDATPDRLDMMGTVRVLGGAMIGIAILVVVLNEVFSLNQISNSSGPFSSVIESLQTTGGAALGLLVIGLLVMGANRVMGFFGGGGF